MSEVTFEIPGEPMGKQRPKFRSTGKFVQTYTPDKTVNYETLVKELYAINQYPMLQGELSVEVTAYLTIPESASQKKKDQMKNGDIHPTKKPDLDNILKIICDALNKIAYKDDAQIVSAHVYKVFAVERPFVRVKIREVRGD